MEDLNLSQAGVDDDLNSDSKLGRLINKIEDGGFEPSMGFDESSAAINRHSKMKNE